MSLSYKQNHCPDSSKYTLASSSLARASWTCSGDGRRVALSRQISTLKVKLFWLSFVDCGGVLSMTRRCVQVGYLLPSSQAKPFHSDDKLLSITFSLRLALIVSSAKNSKFVQRPPTSNQFPRNKSPSVTGLRAISELCRADRAIPS